MKKNLLMAISALLLSGCIESSVSSDKDRGQFFYNRKGIIVSMGESDGAANKKYRTPVPCATILIRDIIDTTLFVEASTCSNYNNNFPVTREWYYNHQTGDSVKFDFIGKRRYFKITSR